MNCSEQQRGHRALFENLETRSLMSVALAAPLSPIVPSTPPTIMPVSNGDESLEGPQKLSVTGTTIESISLEWNAVKAEGFTIERSVDGKKFDAIAKVDGDVTQFTDKGLLAGTKYFYRVRAFANGDVSRASPVAEATTLSLGTPQFKDPTIGIE